MTSTVCHAVVAAILFSGLYFTVRVLLLPREGWLTQSLAILVALGASWLAWHVGRTPLGASVLSHAVLVGVSGFLLGFFGPMIVFPDANQGPLFGIFCSGPAGVLLGAWLGFLRFRWQAPPKGDSASQGGA